MLLRDGVYRLDAGLFQFVKAPVSVKCDETSLPVLEQEASACCEGCKDAQFRAAWLRPRGPRMGDAAIMWTMRTPEQV